MPSCPFPDRKQEDVIFISFIFMYLGTIFNTQKAPLQRSVHTKKNHRLITKKQSLHWTLNNLPQRKPSSPGTIPQFWPEKSRLIWENWCSCMHQLVCYPCVGQRQSGHKFEVPLIHKLHTLSQCRWDWLVERSNGGGKRIFPERKFTNVRGRWELLGGENWAGCMSGRGKAAAFPARRGKSM